MKKIKVGTKFKFINNGYCKDYTDISMNKIYTITCFKKSDTTRFDYCIGFKHHYNGLNDVSNGTVPNWNVSIDEDIVIVNDYINYPQSLIGS